MSGLLSQYVECLRLSFCSPTFTFVGPPYKCALRFGLSPFDVVIGRGERHCGHRNVHVLASVKLHL